MEHVIWILTLNLQEVVKTLTSNKYEYICTQKQDVQVHYQVINSSERLDTNAHILYSLVPLAKHPYNSILKQIMGPTHSKRTTRM